MAFCLGTLLKTVKKYEINQAVSDIDFVNNFLGCFIDISMYSTPYEKANFDKTVVSKILNCKYNPPDILKCRLKDFELQEEISNSLCCYVKENLQKGCCNELSSDVLKLCDKNSKHQLKIFNKLYGANSSIDVDNDCLDVEMSRLSNFLAIALNEAVQISNIAETDYRIYGSGNCMLYLHSGDIFKFCFNRKSRSKNIVIIPTNTRFDTHVSRKFEGEVQQVISDKTLHGMWIDRMIRRSKTKEKVDNQWNACNEGTLKQRIQNDLEKRGYKPDSMNEFPLGSIAVLEEENTIFYLLATSKFDGNNNAHATNIEIRSVLKSLIQFYDCNGQGQDMYLPLIGTGMSRAGLSNQESFSEICKVFCSKENSFVGKVTIVVLPEVFENLNLGD